LNIVNSIKPLALKNVIPQVKMALMSME